MAERDGSAGDTVRLDKWLWAARFFKTRSLAAEGIDGGKVHVNGERAKRAKEVRVGDTVRVRLGAFEQIVEVRGVSERRGPAVVAQTLYAETAESAAARAKLREQHALSAWSFEAAKGRPTKKDRREIRRFKGGD